MRNSNGPRTEPRGTPDRTFVMGEDSLSTTTYSIKCDRHSWHLHYWSNDEWQPCTNFHSDLTHISWPALDFETAVNKLSTITVSATCYFIVVWSWPGEAVVITRARNQVQDLWWRGNKTQHWFIVQANSDHWETGDLLVASVSVNTYSSLVEDNTTVTHLTFCFITK